MRRWRKDGDVTMLMMTERFVFWFFFVWCWCCCRCVVLLTSLVLFPICRGILNRRIDRRIGFIAAQDIIFDPLSEGRFGSAIVERSNEFWSFFRFFIVLCSSLWVDFLYFLYFSYIVLSWFIFWFFVPGEWNTFCWEMWDYVLISLFFFNNIVTPKRIGEKT